MLHGSPGPHKGRLAALVLLAAAGPAAAQPVLDIPRADRPPRVQDFLDGSPRAAAATVAPFTQREPHDGMPVSQATTAYLSYDDQNLYVAFVCRDTDPSRLRARLAPRESIAADDQVAVLLDTFHDRRRAYLFAVNPLGVQSDALITEGQPDDYSYEAVWGSAGRLTGTGFVALITIPFKSVRLPDAPRQEWGIALLRQVPRNSEQSYWPPITRRVEGLVAQFATARGIDAVARGRNLQVAPYATLAAAAVRGDGAPFEHRTDPRAGFDAKLVARGSLTLDVAVNPDFSQVESDQPQVTTNQRFEVFFPEKRPFFIENAGYFLYGAVPAVRNVPETLFFSRRIADPAAGVRLTGKAGRWALGALAVRDRGGLGPPAGVGVVRLQREVGRQSSFGLFGSSRTLDGEGNQVAAFDGRLKIGPNWVVSGFGAASRTTTATQTPRWGGAANVHVNRTSRRLLYNLFYSDRSPSFRAAAGFVPRTDIRQVEQYVEYRWRPSRGPVVAVGPNSYVRLNWDRSGRLQEWIVRYPFQIDFRGRTSVFVRRVESGEVVRGLEFRQHLQTLNIVTEWFKVLSVSESLEGGTTVNFFPVDGRPPVPASFLTASLGASLRATPRLRVDATYLFSRLSTLGAEPIFATHLGRLTVGYQFTRQLSARAIVDSRAVLPDVRLVALRADRRLTTDLLISYFVQPGTAIYGGYTAGFDRSLLSSRQVFVKASYLLRF